MKSSRFIILALALMSLSLFVQGCSKRTIVPLVYEPAGIESAGGCPGPVAVNPMKNAILTNIIGNDIEMTSYSIYDDLGEWVDGALMLELAQVGCAPKATLDKNPEWARFTISGKIKDVFVKQEGISEFKTTVKIRFMVRDRGELVFKDNFVVKSRTTTFPTIMAREEMQEGLTAGLQEVMKRAVPRLARVMRQRAEMTAQGQ